MPSATTTVEMTKETEPSQMRELLPGFGVDLGSWDLSSGVTDDQFAIIKDLATKVMIF